MCSFCRLVCLIIETTNLVFVSVWQKKSFLSVLNEFLRNQQCRLSGFKDGSQQSLVKTKTIDFLNSVFLFVYQRESKQLKCSNDVWFRKRFLDCSQDYKDLLIIILDTGREHIEIIALSSSLVLVIRLLAPVIAVALGLGITEEVCRLEEVKIPAFIPKQNKTESPFQAASS